MPGALFRSWGSSVLVALALVLVVAVGPARAAGTERVTLGAAREALGLTGQRLGLMKEVMASKWLSRAPIQDLGQEEAVKEAAVARGLELGVAAGSTRGLFAAEIAAAKEVQLGWGSHWLFYGAPAELAAPDLTALRASLAEISERLVALLPKLIGLGGVSEAEARVAVAARKALKVPYLGAEGRAGIVEALVAIRGRTPAG